MRRFCRHNTVSRYAMVLLTIFLTYLCSNSLFMHYHDIADSKIAHSHIYFGSQGNPEHSHTQTQLQLLEYLADFTSLEAVTPAVQAAQVLFFCGIVLLGAERTVSHTAALHLLRAPPVTMIL